LDGHHRHGSITFLTTNCPKILDRALVRDGRVDHIYKFGQCSEDQFIRYFENFFGSGSYQGAYQASFGHSHQTSFDPTRLSPAECLSMCRKHFDDPEGALKAFETFDPEARYRFE
jgi:hypothetical protein